jgi:drug/metabolite transporter (DMT)-like permease
VFAPYFLFWTPASGFHKGVVSVPVGALALALLLMGYNYAWLLSSRYLAVGLTNAIFQTSIAFVYLASVFIFHDNFEGVQVLGVVFALSGSFLASGFESPITPQTSPDASLGIFLALLGAIGCMAYQVLFKYLYSHLKSDARFLAHIGAWVSVWHLLVILPLAGLAHAVGFEEMQLPHGYVAVLGTLASACIASTVNAMYICIVMWGSSMLLPCASALSVPGMVSLDLFLHHVVPAKIEIFGHLLVVLSVVMIMGLHKMVFLKSKHLKAELSFSSP